VPIPIITTTMFSANENILLRQHKRRIIQYVESTIPESALDLGTTVMVMQVSCQSPGCVPLETCVTVVFPRPPSKKKKKLKRPNSGATNVTNNNPNIEETPAENEKDEIPSFPEPLLPNLPESQTGGSFKTRILKPLSEVTMDDVLDSLPPSFEGGRRTWESVCMKARDVIFAQIGQIMGNGEGDEVASEASGVSVPEGKDFERRKMVAKYLQVCLQEYIDRGCIAPEWGEPFPPLDIPSATSTIYNNSDGGERSGTGDKHDMQSKGKIGGGKESNDENSIKTTSADEHITTKTESMSMDEKFGKGNFVFRRPMDSEDDVLANKNGK